MNLIFGAKPPIKPGKSTTKVLYIILLGIALFLGGAVFLSRLIPADKPESPPALSSPVVEVNNLNTIISEVAVSYGFPPSVALRLSEYLLGNDFNGLYGGVGPFSVRPSHLEWVKGSILQGVLVNLEEPIQNSQVALFLLSRFQRSGYDPITSALIYCYGFPAIHERDKYSGFLRFMKGDDLDD
jgi:hypothetical protein